MIPVVDGMPPPGRPGTAPHDGAMSRLVELPLEIKWSGPLRSYDLDDPRDRLVVYELVLQEGDASHVREYIDVDELLQLWDDMYLPVGVETAWAGYFERVRGTRCDGDGPLRDPRARSPLVLRSARV